MMGIEDFIQEIIKLSPRYVINGTDPRDIDCLKFFVLTQKKLFGRDIPLLSLDEDDIRAWVKLVVQYKKLLSAWKEVQKPVHGCAVELTHSERPYHVGTWLNYSGGGVLHFTRSGLNFQSQRELKLAGWSKLIYDIPV